MSYFLKCLKNYAVFKGRASRKEFWFFFLFNMIFCYTLLVLLRSIFVIDNLKALKALFNWYLFLSLFIQTFVALIVLLLAWLILGHAISTIIFVVIFGITSLWEGFWLVPLFLYILAILIPGVAVAVRRMHDIDKSGWYSLIPIYNLILTVKSGTKGPNRFGDAPNTFTASQKDEDMPKAVPKPTPTPAVPPLVPNTTKPEPVPPLAAEPKPAIAIAPAFRAILQRIIAERGVKILGNTAMCRALLRDYAEGAYQAECRLLLTAVESGAAAEMANSEDPDITRPKLAQRLCADYFINTAAAESIIALLEQCTGGQKGEKA
jgi:uncharacterized membrane protein YhaH (DUF805 family)